jgi:hypothetical protein
MRAKLDFWRGWKKHRGGEEKKSSQEAKSCNLQPTESTSLSLIKMNKNTTKSNITTPPST